MNRHIIRMIGWLLLALPLFSQPVSNESNVRIVRLHGDVRVRSGLDEAWTAAGLGMQLKPLDSVFAGEASEVVLVLGDETRFVLGGNAVLDIGDLRRITERQLFLFLMSQKVGRIAAHDSSTTIRIANVSVVRGSQKQIQAEPLPLPDAQGWVREKNGAKALFDAGYYANAVVKFYTVLRRHPGVPDRGEIHLYLGQAFESLNETGCALDAYQTALDRVNAGPEMPKQLVERKAQIEAALLRLKSKP